MTRQMLIYDNAVPVDSNVHRDLSIRPNTGYAFARHISAVPVVAAEFAAAATDLAIVFAGAEDGTMPFAVLGVETERNLMVNPDGTWAGRYVPSFLRRYPFALAKDDENDTLALCVDDGFEGLNTKGIGERLFDAEGNRTQFLDGVLGFATQIQTQFARTRQFCIRLEKLELLEPAAALVPGVGSEPRRITGIQRVSRERLKRIPADTLQEMFSTDELELCYLHLQSMANLDRLKDRMAALRPETAIVDPDVPEMDGRAPEAASSGATG